MTRFTTASFLGEISLALTIITQQYFDKRKRATNYKLIKTTKRIFKSKIKLMATERKREKVLAQQSEDFKILFKIRLLIKQILSAMETI